MSDSERLVIRGGRIIDPAQNLDSPGDVWISDGKIQKITPSGAPLSGPQTELKTHILEAGGAWILPGFIDVHVHLREPGQEHKETIESGTRAAISGGFTAVACMANTNPVNDCAEITTQILNIADQTAACRVYPVGAITRGLRGEELADIHGMVRAGARAISDDGMTLMNSALMRQAMEIARELRVPVISHSEDLHLAHSGVMHEGVRSRQLGLPGNPAEAEEISVARDIALCRLTGCPIHIAHLSTELALNHIKRAKDAGLPVTAEVTPHHLALTDEDVDGSDANYKMAPPLRSKRDRDAMIAALADGTIDMIATDHAPHAPGEKSGGMRNAANGITGLQTAASITFALATEGKLPLARWVDALTTAPARLLGLPYGTLKPGATADLILFEPKRKWVLTESSLLSRSRNSPFMGRPLLGKVVHTFLGGSAVQVQAPK